MGRRRMSETGGSVAPESELLCTGCGRTVAGAGAADGALLRPGALRRARLLLLVLLLVLAADGAARVRHHVFAAGAEPC